MDNLNYNASHAPDPTAREAIMTADEMPVKISDTIKCIKILMRMNNLELAKKESRSETRKPAVSGNNNIMGRE